MHTSFSALRAALAAPLLRFCELLLLLAAETQRLTCGTVASASCLPCSWPWLPYCARACQPSCSLPPAPATSMSLHSTTIKSRKIVTFTWRHAPRLQVVHGCTVCQLIKDDHVCRTILDHTQYTKSSSRDTAARRRLGCPIMEPFVHALSDLAALVSSPGMEAQAWHVVHRLGVRLCCVLIILSACLPTNKSA